MKCFYLKIVNSGLAIPYDLPDNDYSSDNVQLLITEK
jgi:hypothetical protein